MTDCIKKFTADACKAFICAIETPLTDEPDFSDPITTVIRYTVIYPLLASLLQLLAVAMFFTLPALMIGALAFTNLSTSEVITGALLLAIACPITIFFFNYIQTPVIGPLIARLPATAGLIQKGDIHEYCANLTDYLFSAPPEQKNVEECMDPNY